MPFAKSTQKDKTPHPPIGAQEAIFHPMSSEPGSNVTQSDEF